MTPLKEEHLHAPIKQRDKEHAVLLCSRAQTREAGRLSFTENRNLACIDIEDWRVFQAN